MGATAGLLLTGGRSRRLGTDKARLVVEGGLLAHRAAARLGAVCDPLLEVGPGVSGRPHVVDDPPGRGPLAALVAGVAALAERGFDGGVVLLGVDLLKVDTGLLRLLRDWPGAPSAVPESGGRLQPVCARYGPPELTAAASLVAAGVRSLHALLDVVEYDVLAEDVWRSVAPPDVFDDVDTPDDARRLGIDLGRLR